MGYETTTEEKEQAYALLREEIITAYNNTDLISGAINPKATEQALIKWYENYLQLAGERGDILKFTKPEIVDGKISFSYTFNAIKAADVMTYDMPIDFGGLLKIKTRLPRKKKKQLRKKLKA